jgi:hypothetical protein
MAAKQQFASAQRCFHKRNGGMRECAILLENLSLVRKGTRNPGPHILAKQRLVGAGGEPLSFSDFPQWRRRHNFWWRPSFLRFWVFVFNSLYVFYTVWQLFYFKKILSDTPKQRCKIGDG